LETVASGALSGVGVLPVLLADSWRTALLTALAVLVLRRPVPVVVLASLVYSATSYSQTWGKPAGLGHGLRRLTAATRNSPLVAS
jgi:membrane associated rhomboid family serine protease